MRLLLRRCMRRIVLRWSKYLATGLMKKILILVFFISCSASSKGQTNFQKLIKNIKSITLPYSTDGFQNKSYQISKKRLRGQDSISIVNQLKKIQSTIVNPSNASPFGELDCPDISDCKYIEEVKSLSILGLIKLNSNYLLHIEINGDLPRGILVSMNNQGKIIDWMFSNGSLNGGNPNGNVTRDLSVSTNKEIKIDEVSWGKNTERYTLKAIYKIVKSSQLDDKIKIGKFKIKSFWINN